MTCEICGKGEATVRYTVWENNQSRSLTVCHDCAVEKGIIVVPTDKEKFSIQEPIIALFGEGTAGSRVGKVQCPRCGLLYSNFKETGRLGCASCYDSFEELLKPLLRRLHGNLGHSGKVPRREDDADQRRIQIRKLQEEIESAIHRENFERAAELRDRIRRLRESDPDPAGEMS